MRKFNWFQGACWGLALVAFLELSLIGIALVLKQRPLPPIIVEAPPYVINPPRQIVSDQKKEESKGRNQEIDHKVLEEFSKLSGAFLQESQSSEKKLSEEAPTIDHPVVERLFQEAQKAKVKGDMQLALVKLEEALTHYEKEKGSSGDQANLFYELGLIYEEMGIYDRASESYYQVYEMGSVKAKGLYALAARKLTSGFEEQSDLLMLGRVREFRDTRVTNGQKVVLTIPVVAAPGERIDPKEVQVEVNFFDKKNGEIVLPDIASQPSFSWVTEPVDWSGVKEELLQVTYELKPIEDHEQHLFGLREYYGYVVELYYRGNILDQQAWPRLLARQKKVPEEFPLSLPPEYYPKDLNPVNPLLPALEDE